jgi:hypothetical protein
MGISSTEADPQDITAQIDELIRLGVDTKRINVDTD